MHPVAFDEENTVLDAPKVMPEAEPLPVWIGNMIDGLPVIISCFKLSKEELAEVNRTGRVWLLVAGQNMPCVSLDGFNPWKKDDAKSSG